MTIRLILSVSERSSRKDHPSFFSGDRNLRDDLSLSSLEQSSDRRTQPSSNRSSPFDHSIVGLCSLENVGSVQYRFSESFVSRIVGSAGLSAERGGGERRGRRPVSSVGLTSSEGLHRSLSSSVQFIPNLQISFRVARAGPTPTCERRFSLQHSSSRTFPPTSKPSWPRLSFLDILLLLLLVVRQSRSVLLIIKIREERKIRNEKVVWKKKKKSLVNAFCLRWPSVSCCVERLPLVLLVEDSRRRLADAFAIHRAPADADEDSLADR